MCVRQTESARVGGHKILDKFTCAVYTTVLLLSHVPLLVIVVVVIVVLVVVVDFWSCEKINSDKHSCVNKCRY